ncbi:hypothetical protein POL88_15515 [Priestia megaterium]|uniref:phage tail assembly chaperone G n=1 Tax=Priestia megaterium TaxID=1404 RepID=UPI00234F62D7|nr:hypothetical protein [Priestia megaterium]MDC7770335.1 hypothetical protein [Priestia megaterium]
MANLKRNVIELIKEISEDGEILKSEKYLTPVFIPLSVVYQAMDLTSDMQDASAANERELIDRFVDFIVHDIYKDKFTKEELINGLHAPDAMETLRDQIRFVAQGYQSDETKKFLEKKN